MGDSVGASEAKTEAKVDAEAAGHANDDANTRRVRRRRTATQTAPLARADSEKREPRRRRRRPDKARDGGNEAADAVGATTSRRVYRQDYPGAGSLPAAPAEPSADDLRAAKVKKAEEQNKITLILHPPPKHLKRKGKKKRFKNAKEALKARSAQNQKRRGQKANKAAPKAATEIKPEWLDLEGDAAIEALKLGGENLVRAWLKKNNTAAIVACAHSTSITGSARKAAKRAIGALKSRGISVEEPKRPKFQLQPEEHAVLASFIPPDASGVTFYSISQRQASGRYRVADIMVRDQLGIVHASSGELPGKQIRKWKARVREQFGAMPIEVSLDWARYRIAEGLRKNKESRQVVPLGFTSCSELIEPVPSDAPAHPIDDLIKAAQSDEKLKDSAEASRELHQEPEFANWLPDKIALDELFAKVGERVGTENSGDQELVNKILDEEMAAATDRFFTPEQREVLVGRMHDSAISVRKRKGDAAALQVIGVTQAIANAGLITSPPSEIPFLLSFFQKGVAFAIQRNQGRLQVPVAG